MTTNAVGGDHDRHRRDIRHRPHGVELDFTAATYGSVQERSQVQSMMRRHRTQQPMSMATCLTLR